MLFYAVEVYNCPRSWLSERRFCGSFAVLWRTIPRCHEVAFTGGPGVEASTS